MQSRTTSSRSTNDRTVPRPSKFPLSPKRDFGGNRTRDLDEPDPDSNSDAVLPTTSLTDSTATVGPASRPSSRAPGTVGFELRRGIRLGAQLPPCATASTRASDSTCLGSAPGRSSRAPATADSAGSRSAPGCSCRAPATAGSEPRLSAYLGARLPPCIAAPTHGSDSAGPGPAPRPSSRAPRSTG